MTFVLVTQATAKRWTCFAKQHSGRKLSESRSRFNRGVGYSLGHVHLAHDGYEGHRYWDFSFAEIGKYDIPAMVDTIKHELVEQHYYDVNYDNIDKIQYIGYD